MKYRVAQDEDYGDFVQEVNEALADDWQPQGGVCIVLHPDGVRVYYQALIKEEA